MTGLTGWHLVILIAVVVLLFGAKRLPDMARAIGQSTRIFKHEIKHNTTTEQPTPPPPSTPPTVAPNPHPGPADHGMPSQPATPDRTPPPTP
ncbi:MAG: Sec-independent protein translocase subunit TatA [Pseudonocardiales bacterium]|nr:Sec-independent protein translocase subunit TatA [Pseudonocardiales bacterium]